MTKRLVSAAASVAAIGAAALALAPSAMAAPNGGLCQLTGTANFAPPGLTTSSAPFSYTFSGTLTNCHSGSSAGLNSTPTGGTVFTPDPVSGSGGCATSTTGGVAIVQWNDQNTTVVKYTTTGALAAVVQQGSVVASYTSTTQKDPLGNPITYTTNEPSTPVGDSAGGVLTFSPSSPTACQSGVTSAAINGAIGTGSPS
jgi:hypothetical protein